MPVPRPLDALCPHALDIDADPEDARPVILFATDPDDPEMAPEQVYRIYRDRFQIEFNFRDAKQHLGLDHFSMTNVKLKSFLESFLELVLHRLFDTDGAGPDPAKIPGGPAGTVGQIEPQPP